MKRQTKLQNGQLPDLPATRWTGYHLHIVGSYGTRIMGILIGSKLTSFDDDDDDDIDDGSYDRSYYENSAGAKIYALRY